MQPIDSSIPTEIRSTVRKLEELWALTEEPPEGLDIEESLADYLAGAGEDVVLATALYLKASLEPAIEVGTRERARVLRLKQANERKRAWMRVKIAEMLDRLGVDRVQGALVSVSRTAGSHAVEQDPLVDLSLLPERFLKPRQPAIAEIEAALLRGEKVPGFRRVQRPGVQIR